MKARTLFVGIVVAPALTLKVLVAAETVIQHLPTPAKTQVDFARDIKPLLETSCVDCHSGAKPKSGHRVDTRQAIIKGGESDEAAILPGESEKSPLVHYIAGLVPDMEMPPLDSRDEHPALTQEQIALVRAWIDQGVPWPDGIALTRRNPATHTIAASTDAESTHSNHPIFADIRGGNTHAMADSLTDPSVFQLRDKAGNTPLMQAAFYLDATQLDIFLKNGADPNATNRAGATALMKAASDRDKVRTLLNHGAKPNVQSAAGNTALIIACRNHGAVEVVNELLAHGADVHASTPAGINALVAATESGDEDVMRVLLARGANANATFRPPYSTAAESVLMVAVQYGHAGCVKLLLDHGADARFTSDYGSALHFAAMKDRLEIARVLIERGVDIDLPARRIGSFRNDLGLTPLMYAAMTERDDPALVQLLIEHGASVNAKTPEGETALGLAQKRGDTKVVAALKAAGGTAEAETAPSILSARWSEEEVGRTADPIILRTAAADGLATLIKSGVRFADATANRCVTCHQHSQPAVAYGLASEKQLVYDDAVVRKLVRSTVTTAARRVDSMLEEPAQVPSISAWLLIGLHASGHDADELTDAVAYSLARSQFSDGRWITRVARAPTDYSDVSSTALALRALKVYSPPTMKKQFERRIERAATWLHGVHPTSTEERAFQILGLLWAGSDRKQLAGLINDLVQEQREDGGWAQLPKLKSDAYATGLTLYALSQGGGLSLSHPAYQKGTRFLLTEQRSDGSWFVATRASPVQVAVDDVFAHGKHQWISSSATTWATMALMLGETHERRQSRRPCRRHAVFDTSGQINRQFATWSCIRPHQLASLGTSLATRIVISALFRLSCFSCI